MLSQHPVAAPHEPPHNVLHLPLTRDERERAVTRMIDAPQGPVTIMEIARRLTINEASPRSIIDQVRLLHKNHGFPEPASPRFLHGLRQRGERAIVWRSKWARDLVEAWFSDNDTPANAALADEAGRNRARAALAANAERLCAAGGQ